MAARTIPTAAPRRQAGWHDVRRQVDGGVKREHAAVWAAAVNRRQRKAANRHPQVRWCTGDHTLMGAGWARSGHAMVLSWSAGTRKTVCAHRGGLAPPDQEHVAGTLLAPSGRCRRLSMRAGLGRPRYFLAVSFFITSQDTTAT
jgi:hypothetical protein